MLPTEELLWTRWLLNMRLWHALKPGHEGKEVDANRYNKILGAEDGWRKTVKVTEMLWTARTIVVLKMVHSDSEGK